MSISYTITAIDGDLLTVEYTDGSWAQFRVTEGMTQENVDDLAYQFAPKPVGNPPAFVVVGSQNTAQPMPATQLSPEELRRAYYVVEADPIFFKWQRGTATEQQWLDKILEIKSRYPD